MPTYSQSFPHRASDGTGWGLPQLKIAHDDGSVSIVTPPTGDDPGPPAWQEAPAEVRSLDWSPVPQPNEPPAGWALWPGEFQGLFTDGELVAIQTSVDANVIRFRTMVQTFVEKIRQDDPRLLPSLMLLESLGILTTARRERIYLGYVPE
jgi:hypothetical protein